MGSSTYPTSSAHSSTTVFSRGSQCVAKIMHEVLLFVKFLQTKPQVKSMNINCYDLYYTVIKNRDKKEEEE